MTASLTRVANRLCRPFRACGFGLPLPGAALRLPRADLLRPCGAGRQSPASRRDNHTPAQGRAQRRPGNQNAPETTRPVRATPRAAADRLCRPCRACGFGLPLPGAALRLPRADLLRPCGAGRQSPASRRDNHTPAQGRAQRRPGNQNAPETTRPVRATPRPAANRLCRPFGASGYGLPLPGAALRLPRADLLCPYGAWWERLRPEGTITHQPRAKRSAALGFVARRRAHAL